VRPWATFGRLRKLFFFSPHGNRTPDGVLRSLIASVRSRNFFYNECQKGAIVLAEGTAVKVSGVELTRWLKVKE
jgi:hypothetical protein